MFLLGLYFFIGVSGILKFFTKKGKIQGSFVYFGGFLLIVFGWTIIGTLAQVMGFFIIFRSFLPDFYDYLCRMPFVGPYLSNPPLTQKATPSRMLWINSLAITATESDTHHH